MTLYNLMQSRLSTPYMEGNLEYWKQTTSLNKLHTFIPYFVHLGTSIAIYVIKRKRPCLVGVY